MRAEMTEISNGIAANDCTWRQIVSNSKFNPQLILMANAEGGTGAYFYLQFTRKGHVIMPSIRWND